MTFEKWFEKIPGQGRFTRQQCKDIAKASWDVSTVSERSRCAQIVWEYRGMCVSDESARALMEEVRRVR
jgi:hypothetical protein